MNPAETLQLVANAYRLLSDREWQKSTVKGNLRATLENAKLVASLDESDAISAPSPFPLDEEIAIPVELLLPRGPNGFFARDLAEVVGSVPQRWEPPSAIYIADADVFFDADVNDDEVPNILRGNFDSICLVATLRSIADHVDMVEHGLRLIFLQEEKLEITILPAADILRPLIGLKEWRIMMSEAAHRNEKLRIFKKLLLEELGSIPVVERWGRLVTRFDELYGRFKDRYALYVAEFLPEKIEEEVNRRKSEWVGRLHKAFSEMQGQIIGIPLALLVAAGQMGPNKTISNAVIFIAVCSFAFLLKLSLDNQGENVSALEHEIAADRALMEKKYRAVWYRFDNEFSNFDTRIKSLRRRLFMVDVLGAALIVLVGALFYWYQT